MTTFWKPKIAVAAHVWTRSYQLPINLTNIQPTLIQPVTRFTNDPLLTNDPFLKDTHSASGQIPNYPIWAQWPLSQWLQFSQWPNHRWQWFRGFCQFVASIEIKPSDPDLMKTSSQSPIWTWLVKGISDDYDVMLHRLPWKEMRDKNKDFCCY